MLYNIKYYFFYSIFVNMILIADSGSTKTSWRFLEKNGTVHSLETSGINPFFRTSEDIAEELNVLLKTENSVDDIFFYGAGIVDESKALIIKKALFSIYPKSKIEVYNDLIGAAKSVCGNKEGIACILGTGSNCCYYDGQKIVDKISPLGFILGDEGGGAVMGKHLIGDYFKNVMPLSVRRIFDAQFNLNQAEVLERVYKQEKPNHFLASFTYFLSNNINESYCRNFVINRFSEFIERNVLMLPQHKRVKINFVGSMAYIFEEQLDAVLKKYNLNKGNIIKNPIEGLVEYHKNIRN